MRMTSKEKRAITWGSAFVILILYINFYVIPTRAQLQVMDNRIKTNQDKLRKMYRLKAEYDALYRVMLHSNPNRKFEVKEDTSLLTFLENLAAKIAIQRKIAFIEPFSEFGGIKKEGARVKLDRVEMSELVDFLYGLEHENNNISVEEMTVSSYSNKKHLLDVNFVIMSVN